jgi:diguanylate cyclase (GGDEF)-like protein
MPAATEPAFETPRGPAALSGSLPGDGLGSDTALLRDVIEQLPMGLSVFDAQDRLVLANARYRTLWRLPEALVQPGTPFGEIIARSHCTETEESQRRPQPRPGEGGLRIRDWLLQDGRCLQVQISRRADGSCVALHEDITARRRLQDRLGFEARHDPLTGLHNRAELGRELDAALHRLQPGAELALLCIDLDGFKPVNDAYGHASGDELLRGVAQRLRQCVREGDALARVGGDEFVIVQDGARQPQGAGALARRIIESIAAPFEVQGQRLQIGCSIGIAVAPYDGQGGQELLHRADLALLAAKADGRGLQRYFEPGMEAQQRARRELEDDLRWALERGQLSLAYQPQLDLASGSVTGVEALLRWTHPVRGSVSPAEFIPLAEETGLIGPIGRWVLQQACRDALAWPVRVAVNVSAVQFRHGQLMADVWAALEASGLPPQQLEIEITESVMLRDPEQVLHTLTALRARGVRVAMDDFGTGYSSLATLRQFSFDRLKIDRSFVRDAESRPDTNAIIAAVALLGRCLGMATTVEGVETERQLKIVSAHGCSEVQGFLFSKPRPASEMALLIQQLQLHGPAGLAQAA